MSNISRQRARSRLALGAGVAIAMLISMTGTASAAGASTSARTGAAAAAAATDPNSQGGDADQFGGYVGYVGQNGAGAGSASDDSHTKKTEKLGTIGSTAGHTPDVPGQSAGSQASDADGAKLVIPAKPAKASVDAVRKTLTSQPQARVIVLLKSKLSLTAGQSAAGLESQQADSADAHAVIAETLAGTGSKKLSEYPLMPAAVYQVTSAGLDALLADPDVASVTPDGQVSADLATSTAVIGSTALNAAGVLGNNFDGNTNGGAYQVAIIDSGVDNQHNAFSGRIVSQACFVTDASCLGGSNSSTAFGSADECTHSTDCDHGTHVASIAAGATFAGGHEGVARGAGIVAIKVAQDNPGSARWTAFFSSIDNALQRVLTLKNSTNRNIVSVNLSIGGGLFNAGDAACNATDPTTGALFGQLQAAGVAVLVAAGNDGSTTQMSFPGCAPNAMAIGATDDSDVPASFTNSNSGLRWWAPGVNVDAAVPTGNNHGVKSGTSMATPHVVGAFALLRECVDGNGVPLSNASVAADLDATGTNVTRNGVTRKRINVLDAATRTVNNNDFASPEVFSGNGPINDFDFTVCSDTEPGEPGPFSLDNGNWWAWTPATTGTATISTEDNGSNVTTFDTSLAVYTGTAFSNLKVIAADDDSGTGLRSLVRFPVNGGTTYRIKVDGFAAANGLLNLHIENGPPPACFGVPATIVGTTGNDVINGTAGNDVIVAGAGNDVINSGAGDDRVCGDEGNDSISTGVGDDFVLGGSGSDTIVGGDGNDILVGNPGSGSNDDAGDAIYGNAGNDFLDGWFGNDVLAGGPGNDTIQGAAGIDTATYAGSATAVSANLATNHAVGEGTDTFVGVENLVGSNLNDVLVGDAGNNSLAGGNGNDRIDGAAGNDVLAGGAGNDVLRGRTGNDNVNGGTGIDTVAYDTSLTAVNVNLTAGISTGEGTDAVSNSTIENVVGSQHSDVITGNALANTLQGLGGNDSITGGPGVDAVYGGIGNDVVRGGAGNDAIVSGDAGNDRVYGDDGNDLVRGGIGNDLIVSGDAGVDRVYGDAGNDLVRGGIGNDTIVSGDAGIDRVYGDDGNDLVRGGIGNDVLVSGDAGNDRVYGDAGNDLVRGGAGNDAIVSGDAGNDRLYGDAGRDLCNGGIGVDAASATCEVIVGVP